jgi:hypothetical protein
MSRERDTELGQGQRNLLQLHGYTKWRRGSYCGAIPGWLCRGPRAWPIYVNRKDSLAVMQHKIEAAVDRRAIFEEAQLRTKLLPTRTP